MHVCGRIWNEGGEGWHFVLIRDSAVEIVPEIDTKFKAGIHNSKEGFPGFCSVITPCSEADFTFNNTHS